MRIATFIILTALYLGLRNDEKEYENLDAECQSLLRKKLAPQLGSEESAKTVKGYGATTKKTTTQSDETSDSNSEDSWLEEHRKAQAKVANRLKQDGNWFTYAKGFTVSGFGFQLKATY